MIGRKWNMYLLKYSVFTILYYLATLVKSKMPKVASGMLLTIVNETVYWLNNRVEGWSYK